MRKMTRVIALIFMIYPFFSCKKKVANVSVETSVMFAVKNNVQTDLLAPGTANGFNQQNIQIFNLIDGTYQLINKSSMDFPKNIKIFKKQNAAEYQLELFVNTETDKSGISYTLIQFGENKPDTVKAEIVRNGGSIGLGKVWLNNALIDRITPTVIVK
ncbi:hypothetical protein [Pedobacter sp. GR22-10]|uniref:hypothetical protein n=1 Tax=Pedobacter sp. GR22-10 TaxID=2994472 RepID=UPI0022479191|nr:hypothetical protein [Pedobacter sp. GR22-10]MCX2430894.1 hypothetical protein [Pedobacter sp. GR22-10]